MNPWTAWLISEIIKLTAQRLLEAGKFDSLTEEEAKAMALQIGGGLSSTLPSPEELES